MLLFLTLGITLLAAPALANDHRASDGGDELRELVLAPEAPDEMELGERIELKLLVCVTDSSGESCADAPKARMIPSNGVLNAWRKFGNGPIWVVLAREEGTGTLIVRIKQGKEDKALRTRRTITVTPRTSPPDDPIDDLDPFGVFERALLPTRVEANPEEVYVGTNESVYVQILECDDDGACRAPATTVTFEHDGDGDIVADSVEVSDRGWVRFLTGDRSEFDVPRAITDVGQKIFSLAVEEGVRTGREQADFNGRNGIDPGDVFQVWARIGTTEADPHWDPWFDLVSDGVIDLADVDEANARAQQAGNEPFDVTSAIGEPPTFGDAPAQGG